MHIFVSDRYREWEERQRGAVDFQKKQMEAEGYETSPKLSSNTQGRIIEIILGTEINSDQVVNVDSFHEERTGEEMIFIKNLLKSLPPEISLKVVFQKRDRRDRRKEIKEIFASLGLEPEKTKRLSIVETDSNLVRIAWLRDRVLLGDEGKMYITHPKDNDDFIEDKGESSSLLLESLGVERKNIPYGLEGGDLKVDGDNLYVGVETTLDNILLVGKSEIPFEQGLSGVKDRTQEMGNYFGKQIYPVGLKWLAKKMELLEAFPGAQACKKADLMPPLFHLDLYYTPLGENQVAIGDVGGFVDLLKQNGGFSAFDRDLQEVLKRRREQLYNFSGINDLSRVLARAENFLENQKEVKIFLDSVAEEAGDRGLKVVRVPLCPDGGRMNSALMTYNNSLVENFVEDGKKRRRVFLPRFGTDRNELVSVAGRRPTVLLDEIDAAARRGFESLGLEVVWLDGGFDNTIHGGSLNCRLLDRRLPIDTPKPGV